MAENTSIEWADHTFNPWIGCTKVGPGCDNCYASAWDRRFAVSGHAMHWGAGQARRRTKTWGDPIRWNKQHEAFFVAHGRRQRVFCASLADVFDNAVDPQWRDDLWRLIEATPNLDWLILTKRIGNVGNMLPVPFDFDKHYPNVWLGITVVNQTEADRDIPKLLAEPAAKRFLSMEPLLDPVDLGAWIGNEDCHACGARFFGDEIRLGWWNSDPAVAVDFEDEPEDENDIRRVCPHCGQRDNCGEVGEIDKEDRGDGLHWVIVGGESGPNARPMHPDWARSLRDQCQAAEVPFLFKQWGEWTPGENVERVRGTVDTAFLCSDGWRIYPLNLATDGGHVDDQPDLYRVGKKGAGRHLDGRTWDGVPA